MEGTPDLLGTYGVLSYYTDDPPLNADFEALRWFSLPGEVAAELRRAETSAAE